MFSKSIALGVAACFAASASSAAIVSVTQTAGDAFGAGGLGSAEIITAPDFALDDNVTNTHQQGFDERQGVTLLADLSVDGGIVAKGTVVDSHMIFLNTEGSVRADHDGVEWTFSGRILGVMSDRGGTLEAASTPFLGAVGTAYPATGFSARGLEESTACGTEDGYVVTGSVLCLSMQVTEPGDWIRVVTASEIPVPASLPLIGTALAGLAWFGRRRRRS